MVLPALYTRPQFCCCESSGGRCHSQLIHFTSTYLKTKDVHSLSALYDTSVCKDILMAYFATLATIEHCLEACEVPCPPLSALLTAATNSKASVYALFGGQGTNEVYFDELQSLYDIYKPYVLILTARDVLVPLASKANTDGFSFFSHGLDILAWLDCSAPRPSIEYLTSIPISFPLIGLTQLAQYLVSMHVALLLVVREQPH